MPEYTLARCKAHIPIARCKHGVLRHVAELPGEYPEKRGGDWLVPTMIYAYIHFHSSESRQTRRNRISGWRQASLSPRRCRRRRRHNRDGGETAENRRRVGTPRGNQAFSAFICIKWWDWPCHVRNVSAALIFPANFIILRRCAFHARPRPHFDFAGTTNGGGSLSRK